VIKKSFRSGFFLHSFGNDKKNRLLCGKNLFPLFPLIKAYRNKNISLGKKFIA